jgi:twitching motility protein PilT
MGALDSLLALVESQHARGLVIAVGKPPQLVFDGGSRSLSMPELAAEQVEAFTREVGAVSATGSHYETSTGRIFEVRVDGAGSSLHLSFASATAPRAAGVEPGPVPVRSGAELDARLLDLISVLENEHVSDLLLSSGLPPRVRSGGELHALDGPIVDDAGILALLAPALDDLARAQLEARGSVDRTIELPTSAERGQRFRINLFRQERGVAAALRPIRRVPPRLADLNLPDHLLDLVAYPNGLVLVTGAAGSGKSTTLVALTEHLNRTSTRHIVTLEDPIEYRFTPKRSLIHQRELGRHVEDFAGGLRAALRESPDVIVVGEMRDRETIAAALTAAETGHLVLSTLHSANPWMAIDRVLDAFPGPQQPQIRAQLASVLRAVLSQHLLVSNAPPLRVPAYEKLVVTPAAANQIRDDKVHQLSSTIQTGREDGMVPLEASLAELVRRRRIDPAAARALARDPQLLAELARGELEAAK